MLENYNSFIHRSAINLYKKTLYSFFIFSHSSTAQYNRNFSGTENSSPSSSENIQSPAKKNESEKKILNDVDVQALDTQIKTLEEKNKELMVRYQEII